jgi:hypothetical protein
MNVKRVVEKKFFVASCLCVAPEQSWSMRRRGSNLRAWRELWRLIIGTSYHAMSTNNFTTLPSV